MCAAITRTVSTVVFPTFPAEIWRQLAHLIPPDIVVVEVAVSRQVTMRPQVVYAPGDYAQQFAHPAG